MMEKLGYMYMCIVLSCFLGPVLYYSNEYANMKLYREGPKDMGKLLNLKVNKDDGIASFYRKQVHSH